LFPESELPCSLFPDAVNVLKALNYPEFAGDAGEVICEELDKR